MQAVEPYSELVHELFRQPRCAGALTSEAGVVFAGEAGSIDKGAWVRLHLRIEGSRVTNARFQAYGCPHTLAAAEWVARRLPGQLAAEALQEGATAIAAALDAPPEKLGRLLIVEDALRDCMRRWRTSGRV